jgi:hypothetical protein
MFDRVRALELIEGALDSDPFCPVCHAPTTITDEGGHIVLECSASHPTTFLGRVGAALMPHLRREIVDLSEGIAA